MYVYTRLREIEEKANVKVGGEINYNVELLQTENSYLVSYRNDHLNEHEKTYLYLSGPVVFAEFNVTEATGNWDISSYVSNGGSGEYKVQMLVDEGYLKAENTGYFEYQQEEKPETQ